MSEDKLKTFLRIFSRAFFSDLLIPIIVDYLCERKIAEEVCLSHHL